MHERMLGYNPIISSVNDFIVGEYGFNTITPIRLPQHSMTNNPKLVWPRGIIHYVIDETLGEFLI